MLELKHLAQYWRCLHLYLTPLAIGLTPPPPPPPPLLPPLVLYTCRSSFGAYHVARKLAETLLAAPISVAFAPISPSPTSAPPRHAPCTPTKWAPAMFGLHVSKSEKKTQSSSKNQKQRRETS